MYSQIPIIKKAPYHCVFGSIEGEERVDDIGGTEEVEEKGGK